MGYSPVHPGTGRYPVKPIKTAKPDILSLLDPGFRWGERVFEAVQETQRGAYLKILSAFRAVIPAGLHAAFLEICVLNRRGINPCGRAFPTAQPLRP